MGILIGTLVGIAAIGIVDWFRQRQEAKRWDQVIPPWAEDIPGRAFFSRY
jgi:hypothetical protein